MPDCGKNKDIFSQQPLIVQNFRQYFSQFNTQKVLVITDEDILSDLRVQNQVTALSLLSQDITILKVEPKNHYSEQQKKQFRRKIGLRALKNFWRFPRFFTLFKGLAPEIFLRQKPKQGIYNDNCHLLANKIKTNKYTLVVCNNLISASIIDIQSDVDYVYDIHELEVFRHRKHQSVERSFYIYLQEKKAISHIKNLVTISKKNSEILADLYGLDINQIHRIYNHNFAKNHIALNPSPIKSQVLVYIGRVAKDRGLEDMISLSYSQKLIVIACNYIEEDLAYFITKSNQNNVTVFRGMDYEDFLLQQLKKYSQVYFLALISPTSLSYRNALPNKFFQAQALGLPIIAYKNTYLSKIINTYQCGFIFDEEIKDKLTKVDVDEYYDMCDAMEHDVALAIKKQQL